MSFNPGDVVRLRSGGTAMTVTKVRDGLVDNIDCVWMTDTGYSSYHLFSECALKLVSSYEQSLVGDSSAEYGGTRVIQRPDDDWDSGLSR